MNTLTVLEFVFIVGAAVVAVWSAIRPQPILWIAVILLCVVEAIGHAGNMH